MVHQSIWHLNIFKNQKTHIYKKYLYILQKILSKLVICRTHFNNAINLLSTKNIDGQKPRSRKYYNVHHKCMPNISSEQFGNL